MLNNKELKKLAAQGIRTSGEEPPNLRVEKCCIICKNGEFYDKIHSTHYCVLFHRDVENYNVCDKFELEKLISETSLFSEG